MQECLSLLSVLPIILGVYMSIYVIILRPAMHVKELADAQRRAREFQEGDYVMIRVRLEQFPSGAVKKLQSRGVGLFWV